MKDFKDINKIGNDLKKSLAKLEKLQRQVFADLPNDIKEKVTPIQKDVESALKAFKKGDINKINEIHLRYADSDSK